MKLKTLIQTKRHQIIEIANKHGASNVRIFGSVARGEETAIKHNCIFVIDKR